MKLGLLRGVECSPAGMAAQRNIGAGDKTSLTDAILGVGGKPPYGDDPKDQDWIMRGIQYYRIKHGGE